MDKEKRLFLDWLAKDNVVGNVSHALAISGFSRTTVYRWKKEDYAFSEEWDFIVRDADAVLADVAEHKLYQQVIKGNITAIIFTLKKLRPEKWGDGDRKSSKNVLQYHYPAVEEWLESQIQQEVNKRLLPSKNQK